MRGDHIFVRCGWYSHHGIDCGDNRVIHFDSSPWRMVSGWCGQSLPPTVCETDMAGFSGNRRILTREHQPGDHAQPLDAESVVARAESLLGTQAYHLFGNNCEHFASWCKTGVAHSTQVESASAATRPLAQGIVLGLLLRANPLCPPHLRMAAAAASMGYGVGVAATRYWRKRRANAMESHS